MPDTDALKLQSPVEEQGLIKPTPLEETLSRITHMRNKIIEDINKNRNEAKANTTAKNAQIYCIRYLQDRYRLPIEQIAGLSLEDINRVPEIMFADVGRKVLLLGWIPILGWIFACKYFAFKRRIKFLKTLNRQLFDRSTDIQKVIDAYDIRYYDSSPY